MVVFETVGMSLAVCGDDFVATVSELRFSARQDYIGFCKILLGCMTCPSCPSRCWMESRVSGDGLGVDGYDPFDDWDNVLDVVFCLVSHNQHGNCCCTSYNHGRGVSHA